MAVIEIAKIQVRRGQEGVVGMPQLDGGEFGWAVDTQTLYIGNGSVEEGAPAVGNTEILTSKNIANLFSAGAPYTYGTSFNNTDYTVIDTTIQGSVSRTVSAKLDDFVNVIDFGAKADWNGSTGTNNTYAFQQAINQLYLNVDRALSNSRKTLRIPAGSYYFNSTIYIPPHASLLGEGQDKTILVGNTRNNLLQLCDGTSTGLGVQPYIVFNPGQPYLTSQGRPTNIHIEGITFSYANKYPSQSSYSPLLSLDGLLNGQIINCKFTGLYTYTSMYITDSSNSYDGYSGIEIRSQGTGQVLASSNLLIKDNIFTGLKYGITSSYDCNDIIIINNTFDTLNRAVNYAKTIASYNITGPIRSKITGNIFNNIYNEAIYVGPSNNNLTYHVSSFNSFYLVGTNLGGQAAQYNDSNAVTPIINFISPGNVSIEDKFDRDSYIKKQVSDPTNYLPLVKSKGVIGSNIAYTATMIASTSTPVTLVTIPYAGNDQTINLQYIYTGAGVNGQPQVFVSRKGILSIGISSSLSSTSVTDSHTYTYSGGYTDPETINGVIFSATLNTVSNFVKVAYLENYINGSIEYQYNYLG